MNRDVKVMLENIEAARSALASAGTMRDFMDDDEWTEAWDADVKVLNAVLNGMVALLKSEGKVRDGTSPLPRDSVYRLEYRDDGIYAVAPGGEAVRVARAPGVRDGE